MVKDKILGLTPAFELMIRKVYYSQNPIAKNLILAARKLKTGFNAMVSKESISNGSKWDTVKDYIVELGIHQGDLLIVHSSAEELLRIGANLQEVLRFLWGLVGENGTLAIPCFPLYNDKNYDAGRKMHYYNPKRTICSTGLLPNLFIRTEGVIRSQFPWNSLAAKGALAYDMMKYNLDTDLAHGKGSAWEFCMNHRAKILLLGVKSSHTTTMVHVAEDVLDDKWPVDNWYEEKIFLIKNGTKEKEIAVRTRKPEWARYNASWYRSSQFKKQGILNETEIEGFNVGFIEDSKKMIDFMINRTLQHKPFFVVPKRCYKK